MLDRLSKFYAEARKAVHGALVAVVPVVLGLVQAGASPTVIVLAVIGALVGVGGTVYTTTNQAPSPAPAP